MLQGFSHFRCQHRNGLLFDALYGPNPLIPAVLQSAEEWQEPEGGHWKGTYQCYEAEQIFFHSSGWTA